jgi:hypothetical protein
MTDARSAKVPADPLSDRLKDYLSDTARRELDALRAALESRLLALEAALAHPDPHESLEALVIDLARVATSEAEASAVRASLEAQLESKSRAATAAELERLLDAERAATRALRAEIDEVRNKLQAELSRERAVGKTATAKLAAAERELADARKFQQTAAAKVTALEAAQAQSERAARGAEARLRHADERRHEAELRITEADARKNAATGEQSAAEARQKQAEARAEEADARRRQAEIRASDAEALRQAADARVREVEARRAALETQAADRSRAAEVLTAEIAAIKQVAQRDRDDRDARQADDARQLDDYKQRLAASGERVRSLELQLFKRDRPLQDRDEDLSKMLERDLALMSGRRASRYSFTMVIDVDFGGDPGILVDLSIAGAQVLSSQPLEQGREAILSMISQEVPVAGKGRVVWTRPDPGSEARRFRYRAGILFTAVDAAAVEAFIIRYSAA